MTLITTENGLKKLVPEDGMFLSDGETVAEGEVWLGRLDAPENWKEITPEEKAGLEAEALRALGEEPGETTLSVLAAAE